MNIKDAIKNKSMAMALFIVIILFIVLTGGKLLYPQNLSNLLLQNGYVIIMSCGMLLCILTGGNIDLSVGAIVCLIGAIVARMLNAGINAVLVIVICVGLSALIGAWNGFWISKIHIPSFVCTLAGMFLIRGLARAILESKTIAITNTSFLDTFTSYINIPVLDDGDIKWSALIFGIIISIVITVISIVKWTKDDKTRAAKQIVAYECIQILIIDALIILYSFAVARYKGLSVMALWIIAVCIIYAFITNKTTFGRHCYAVGGNAKAAMLSGINVGKVYFMSYLSMGLLAGLSGLIMAARIGAVNGDTGNTFEMDAIGACFIGGASAYGGRGTIKGVVIGAFLLGVINQGMSILGLDSNWQLVVKGIVLLLAVTFDVVSHHRVGRET